VPPLAGASTSLVAGSKPPAETTTVCLPGLSLMVVGVGAGCGVPSTVIVALGGELETLTVASLSSATLPSASLRSSAVLSGCGGGSARKALYASTASGARPSLSRQ
jgi:hypothetical protein